MSGLSLLLPISLMTQSMQIPLNKLLQSEFVTHVALVYNNNSIESSTAISAAINNAHQHWQTFNDDTAFNKSRYYQKELTDRTPSAQNRDLIILAMNVEQLPTQVDYCLGFLLCSYLIIIEKESIIDDLTKYLKDLIMRLRSDNLIHFLAIMVYSKNGEIGQLYFLSDNNQLIHLDPLLLILDENIYDRIYTVQYKVYRDSATLNIYAPQFSPNMYKTKAKNEDRKEIFIAGNFAYLANMIERYFDTSVVICHEDLLREHSQNKIVMDFLQKLSLEYEPADVMIPFKFISMSHVM